MTYDIVIPLKASEPNEDLRYTLRALCKYGGNFGQLWIVGYKPDWLQGVRYLHRDQDGDKWQNTRENLLAVCAQPDLSENFILYNDDFLLTRSVENWDRMTNFYVGTLHERGEYFRQIGQLNSKWRVGFHFNEAILQKLGVPVPFDYEYHGPIRYDKRLFPLIFDIPEIRNNIHNRDSLIFNRSLYSNLFPRPEAPLKITDSKLREDVKDEDELTRNGFFSVRDRMIGNFEKFPRLNAWLAEHLGLPSRYEINTTIRIF